MPAEVDQFASRSRQARPLDGLRRLVRRSRRVFKRAFAGHADDHGHTKGHSGVIPGLPTLFLYDEGRTAVWHQPLDQPTWRAADEADYMRVDDVVLGIYINGNAWALPWWVMKNHHHANLTLDGTPLLISLCEACSSGAAFDPVIDGKRHSFRLVGRYNGTHVMGDIETNSIWGSFTGEALHGPHQGLVMNRLPLYQCRWEEWRELHPDSLVAYEPAKARLGHGSGESPGSPGLGPGLTKSLVRPLDERMTANALILGAELEGEFKAYPLEFLDAVGGVVNDMLGRHPIVVLHTPNTLIAAAFRRTVDDEVLVFERNAHDAVVDRRHHSHWNHAGEALDGPLAGQALPYVRSGVEEWFVWAAYHPATTIFDRTDDA